MALSMREQKTQAQRAAAAWWTDKSFPEAPWGRPWMCDTCGTVIMAREGTSLVEGHLECPACTERIFPPEAPVAPGGGAAPTGPGPQPTYVAYQVTPPPPPTAPPPVWTPPAFGPPPAPAPARRRRTLLIVGGAVLAVAALVVGLLVWAPWTKEVPKIPTGLQPAAVTATTVSVGWTPGSGGPGVDRYLVYRDGSRIATVDGRSYVDRGLRPGVTYRYTVVAEADSVRSAASKPLAVTTATPSPVGLRRATATVNSVTLQWSAPPASPAPDKYVIVAGGSDQMIDSVPGTQTTYRLTGLDPATTYAFQVVAYWGSARSGPSNELMATTATPSATAARLQGSFSVDVKVTSSGGGNVPRGEAWVDTWQFSPKCASGPCSVVLSGVIQPSGFTARSFTATLVRRGGVYSGSTKASITRCGNAPNIVNVENTISLQLTVRKAAMSGSTWAVSRWTGTMKIATPYTVAGNYYCPAQSLGTTVSGSAG